jgi:hypothetical protein
MPLVCIALIICGAINMNQFCHRALKLQTFVMIASALIALVLVSIESASAQANATKIDGATFVAAAKRHLGKKLGGGGCSEFVNQVLVDTKGQPLVLRPKRVDEKLKEKNLGYRLPDQISIWGQKDIRLVNRSKPSPPPTYKAGQILQFENCRFEKKRADGSLERDWEFPHHTAIIESADGSVVTILHQNAPLGSPVHEDTLDLRLLTNQKDGTRGTLTAFYPKKQ